jgi:hypothetical protein
LGKASSTGLRTLSLASLVNSLAPLAAALANTLASPAASLASNLTSLAAFFNAFSAFFSLQPAANRAQNTNPTHVIKVRVIAATFGRKNDRDVEILSLKEVDSRLICPSES